MNGVMDYNWLGVAFIDDNLPKKVQKKVEKKMEELRTTVDMTFEKWLSDNDLECIMGVIMKKGTIK